MTTNYLSNLKNVSNNPHYKAEVTKRSSPLLQNQLPVILSLKHLCEISGAYYQELYNYVFSNNKSSNLYRVFSIKKRSGGKRWIAVPSDNLKAVQSFINDQILYSDFAISQVANNATAYIQNKGQIFNARKHLYSKDIIKIDISQFFESISERQVFKVFERLGYNRYVAFILTRICTRVIPYQYDYRSKVNRRWSSEKLYKINFNSKNSASKNLTDDWFSNELLIASRQKILIGHLPQGASTSPMLANLVCEAVDNKVNEIANTYNLIYTRYADDIILSGDISNAKVIISEVFKVLSENGFKPNNNKTRVLRNGKRKIVTGVCLNDFELRVPRKYKDKIKQELYFINKFGIEAHCKNINSINLISYVLHLEGKINYVKQIEPELGNKYIQMLNDYVPNLNLYRSLAFNQ